jgi:hypothetical protein
MTQRGYAISSDVEGFPITAEVGTALLQNLRRCEALWVKQLTDPQEANARVWGCRANVDVMWSAETGAVDPDPALCVVQLVPSLPAGVDANIIAYHTVDDSGRPLCLISYVAAGSDWPSAMSHEICESRVDATCNATVRAPDGRVFDLEVCDTVEGSDYEEASVRVANVVGPAYFGIDRGPLDIAGVAAEPFQILPTGYAVIDGSEVFGAMVSGAKKDYILGTHGRPGIRRQRRSSNEP